MADKVRFTRDWEFWPRSGVVVMHTKGAEKRLPQAQVDAALAADAAVLVEDDQPTKPPQDAAPRTTASKEGKR